MTDEPERRVVRLAGRLSGVHVPDLRHACVDTSGRRVFIDISDLVNADSIGIETLRKLQREGATLVDVPEYIRLKLHSVD